MKTFEIFYSNGNRKLLECGSTADLLHYLLETDNEIELIIKITERTDF